MIRKNVMKTLKRKWKSLLRRLDKYRFHWRTYPYPYRYWSIADILSLTLIHKLIGKILEPELIRRGKKLLRHWALNPCSVGQVIQFFCNNFVNVCGLNSFHLGFVFFYSNSNSLFVRVEVNLIKTRYAHCYVISQ